jgi:hypothetical protein
MLTSHSPKRDARRALRAAVLDYCKTQRQWRRSERIAHARHMQSLEGANSEFAFGFWAEVLRLNGART